MKRKIELLSYIPMFFCKKQRLDSVLSGVFSQYSREFLKKCIVNNQVFVDRKVINKPAKKVIGGEEVIIFIIIDVIDSFKPENIVINVIYEDQDILIINKQSDLVVHPAPGHNSGTLLNALMFHYPDIKNLPRAGIVHRLDKNTTGLMVVAKTFVAYRSLIKVIRNRKMSREYVAIVVGSMISGGKIDKPICRHSVYKKKMMVNIVGKKSVTYYRIIKKFQFFTYIGITLETGRTHQIRVHMSSINHPIVGDKLYMSNNPYFSKRNNQDRNNIKDILNFYRPALHSTKLGFKHPVTKEFMEWIIDIPTDMKVLLNSLEK
ncbi:MAG: 23S rRNA pseudouridine(1911/1915/1917) synthase RluD [Buchnera aphidicola (Eriosoma harunire)]